MNFPKRVVKEETIMLTSMMDMFTIILVFLLFNFSGETQKIPKLSKDIKLPYSSSEIKLEEAVNITVSKTAILVEGKIIAKIVNGKTIKARQDGQKIIPLYDALVKEKAKKKRNRSKTSDKKDNEGVVLVKADEKVSFEVLDKVLKSSGMAGFPKSRFVVYRRES